MKANEYTFLLRAIWMGFYITLLYDIVRVFRRVFIHKDWMVSVEDLLFWLYCGGNVFLLMYDEGNGTLRWFAIFGAFLGMFFYRKSIGRIFLQYVPRVFIWIKHVIGKILCSVVVRPCRVCKRGIRELFRVAKNKLTFLNKVLKMTLKK